MNWRAPVVLLLLSGCDLFTPKPVPDGGTSVEPKGPSPRLASWKLPFELADDLTITDGVSRLNFERNKEVGPQIALSLMTAARGSQTKQVEDSMLAVAALPDRVVVVYPAAPDGVMSIAQGGLDRPWVSQPLDATEPILRWQVGALDAVVDVDGSVVIAVRRRPWRLVLYRWRTDGTVTKEVVPLQSPFFSEHWSTSRCPDVRLDATPEGGLVIAYHSGKNTALAWRKPGAQVWTTHLTPPLEYDASVHFDMGCTNRVVFDEYGYPQLLTLVRTWSRKPTEPTPYDDEQPGVSDPVWNLPDFHPTGLAGRYPPVTGAHGYVMRADGKLTRSANASRPSHSIDTSHNWHPGFFAFDRHPGGYLLSGPNVAYQGGTLSYIRLTANQPAPDSASLPPLFELKINLPTNTYEVPGGGMTMEPDPSELSRYGSIEHFEFSECGDVTLWGNAYERGNTNRQYRYLGSACLNDTVAPVERKVSVGFDRTPAFAHGRRPYEVAVCAQETLLAICMGGWERKDEIPFPEETTPKMISSVPVSGPTPLSTDRVVFTLSRAVEADERVFANFVWVNHAEATQIDPQVNGAEVTVVFPQALKPASKYRVAILVAKRSGEGRWLYLDGGRPVVTLTTAKSPGVVDPRVSPMPFRCDGMRVNGTCELSMKIRGQAGPGEYDDVGHSYDYEARPLGVPSVYDAQGNRVTDASAQIMPTGQTRFTWGSTLPRNAKFEARYPAGILTFDGTEWFPEDLKLVFMTRP